MASLIHKSETHITKSATATSSGTEAAAAAAGEEVSAQREVTCAAEEVVSGRERLKRHRRDVAGRVWIPETWEQEKLLKDWGADCSVLDRSLYPAGLLLAREALVEECRRRVSSGNVRLYNSC